MVEILVAAIVCYSVAAYLVGALAAAFSIGFALDPPSLVVDRCYLVRRRARYALLALPFAPLTLPAFLWWLLRDPAEGE